MRGEDLQKGSFSRLVPFQRAPRLGTLEQCVEGDPRNWPLLCVCSHVCLVSLFFSSFFVFCFPLFFFLVFYFDPAPSFRF